MNATVFEDLKNIAIVSSLELGSYEALWDTEEKMSFSKLSKMFVDGKKLPSHFVEPIVAEKYFLEVMERVENAKLDRFGVHIKGTFNYLNSLLDASSPLEIVYYQGIWDLVYSPSVAIVGTRSPSDDGIKCAKRLAKAFAEKGYVIVSGLSVGIDAAAHEAALEAGGQTIAVLGTPLSDVYPKENKNLMDRIAAQHLLISQVPFIKYEKQDLYARRFYFSERNETMSALTKSIIIVEADENSASFVQAQAALKQGRKLFILENNFKNKTLTWPKKLEKKGAIRVRDFKEIWAKI